jgi:hypothetical protein
MKKLLYLLAFGLANTFSLNSFAQAVPLGSGVTAQIVETDNGRFYQKDSLSWEMSQSNGLLDATLLILRREPGYILLQNVKTLDQYTLDFSKSTLSLLKAKALEPVVVGKITQAREASAPGLNGISLLLGMSDRMIHMDADRYFAPVGQTLNTAIQSDGTPGQWNRFFYARMGTSVMPTKGQNVNRVDLSNGDRFQKWSDGIWWELKSDQYSWTNEWLRVPAVAYKELQRDEFSVYLESQTSAKTQVQIDLYTKKVTWSKGKTGAKSQDILDEKFPTYGQFFRTNSDLIDDKFFKTNVKASLAGIQVTAKSRISVDLLYNSCQDSERVFTSCQVLLGEFTPRGITGYSLGGMSLMHGRGNQIGFIDYFDLGWSRGAFTGIIRDTGKSPDSWNLKSWTAFNKRRDGVIFTVAGKKVNVSLSEKSVTPLLPEFTNQALTATQEYFQGQMKGVLPYPNPKLSPGFQIQNRTDHAVLVTLEQVGCLYYGIVKPGETFFRNTGAVWFTVKAVIAPDLKPPTDLSCALNPALMVASVGVAAATGGMLMVPMAMLTGMVQGAAYSTSSYVESKGGTDLEVIAAKTAVLAVGGGLMAFGKTAVLINGSATEAAATAAGLALVSGGVIAGIKVATQAEMDKMTAELTQKASLFGQYAGYSWPWKTKDRVMPMYVITGGPTVKQIKGGGVVYEYQETALTVKKIN